MLSQTANWGLVASGTSWVRVCILGMIFVGAAGTVAEAKKPKAPPAGPAPVASSPPPAPVLPMGPELPADLNRASLRVSALNTIYDLDLSVAQIELLKEAAVKTASKQHRNGVKPNAELAMAFRELEGALLEGKDGDGIANLRNQVISLAGEAELDDDVKPTDAAMARAPGVCAKLKASQIAAFLAVHADEVADPVEMVMASAEAARDLKTAGAANAAAQVDALISETATSAGYLIYGTDEAKAQPLAKEVAAWLKASMEQPDQEFAQRQAGRAAEVKKLVGDVDPMRVLEHWLDLQVAQLLSNPELPAAMEADLLVRRERK